MRLLKFAFVLAARFPMGGLSLFSWRYRPTLLLGRPVEVDTTIDIIFALSN